MAKGELRKPCLQTLARGNRSESNEKDKSSIIEHLS